MVSPLSCSRSLVVEHKRPEQWALVYHAGETPESAIARRARMGARTVLARCPFRTMLAALALAACAGSPHPKTSESLPPVVDAGAEPVECRAIEGESTYTLVLQWEGNVAHGSLRTTRAGQTATLAVQAELYKGLVLVNPLGSPEPARRVATVQEDGPKTMQVGDWKAPWLPCH